MWALGGWDGMGWDTRDSGIWRWRVFIGCFIFACSLFVDLVVWIDSMDIVFLFHSGFAGHYCINY